MEVNSEVHTSAETMKYSWQRSSKLPAPDSWGPAVRKLKQKPQTLNPTKS